MGTSNREVYNRSDVASHYAILNYLTPCEQFLFDLYIKLGMAVLDLGVGGGRTTPYLSQIASRYVGVDYASEMIRICRDKYPHLEFVESEASDLSAFASGSFDAVVMAFNGLDYVIPDGRRVRCLEECNRVLKAGGVLIFSSHNPRQILIRPTLSQQRIRDVAKAFGRFRSMEQIQVPLTAAGWVFALLRAAWKSLLRGGSRIPRLAFWRGEGNLHDNAHGGLITHCWVPRRAIAELQRQGFRCEEVVGDDYPQASGEFVTDWYYYVFSKPNSAGSGENCA
jgi:ubiquinone/menaquinone biosynthesis C-methylase UbiE